MMLRISLLILTLLLTASADRKSDLRAVADAERAFAKLALERGIRDAFYESFAPDGIVFAPHPTNAKERFGPRPSNKDFKLDWWPDFNDVSRAGDMGFSTGPSILTDNTDQKRPPRYGYFFSVWKKQPGGEWKVALDMGIQTPDPEKPLDRRAWSTARDDAYKNAESGSVDVESLKRLEREFSAAAKTDVAAAYAAHLAEQTRLYRNGTFPITGRKAIIAHHRGMAGRGTLAWEPLFADVAASGDFGYTYGRYTIAGPDSPIETGYYSHIWKRDRKGDWKLVADVANALPPDEKRH